VSLLRSSLKPVAIATVLLTLLAALVWKIEYWRLQKRLQTRIELQAADLDRELSQLSVLPVLLSSDPRIVEGLLHPSRESILEANQTLSNAKNVSNVAFAFLMDTKGLTIAASNWQDQVSFVGQNYQFRPYFSGALAGNKTTFFAVGATTGVPGYFIAEPVRHSDKIIGVTVVKIELDQLLDNWKENTFTSLLIDELDVVILSTEPALLYVATINPDPEALATISKDRRYELNKQARLEADSGSYWVTRGWRWQDTESNRLYTSIDTSLATEPWTVRNLAPVTSVISSAAIYYAILVSLITIATLALRNYRQQRLIVESQERQAQLLETQVKQRTHELESAQQALIAQSNFAMLGRMSAAINHEINQPLASLRFNFASLRMMLDSADSNSEEIRNTVIDSDRTTKRIGRVVETLRNVARQRDTDFTAIDIDRLLADVTAIITRERPLASNTLELQTPVVTPERAPHSVLGNEILLQQALLNLLYNAFDATLHTENPTVLLYTREQNHSLLLIVEDNGRGVSQEFVEQLFTPFLTDSSRKGGLGLGLALAKQIIVDHRGTLSYEAVSGGGSKFLVQLPLSGTATFHE